MKRQESTSRSLNAFAPEYNNISPPHAPPPSTAYQINNYYTYVYPPVYQIQSTPPPPPQRPPATVVQSSRGKLTTMPLKPDEDTTTLMIKNIPYACPRMEVMKMIDGFCWLENLKTRAVETAEDEEEAEECAYDFLYVPFDFRTEQNKGFAFVNFTSAQAARKCFESFHQQKVKFDDRYLERPMIIEVGLARMQGIQELVDYFSNSVFVCGSDDFLPVRFSPARDGSERPVELIVIGNRRSAAS